MESYQQKITRAHSAHKAALIGSGGAKEEPPFTIDPSMKRGKSAPPIGEAILQEAGPPDWSKIVSVLKKEKLWAQIEETNYYITILLRKELVVIGKFKAEFQGFDQGEKPVYASHSNLNGAFRGKFLGALGYLLLIEHITRVRHGTIAPFETFEGEGGTSDDAKAAWENLRGTGLIKAKSIIFRTVGDVEVPLDYNDEKITTFFYKNSAPQLMGEIVSAKATSKDWSKKIAHLIMAVIKPIHLRAKIEDDHYKVTVESSFPMGLPPSVYVAKYVLKNNKWFLGALNQFSSPDYKATTQQIKKTIAKDAIEKLKAAEKELGQYFLQLWGKNWALTADKLFFDVLHQEHDSEFTNLDGLKG